MRAQKVETEIRRDQIIQAAMELFALYGSKGITNEQIANLVGIVPSALYKHFKNKSEILDAIGEVMADRVENLMTEAQKNSENPLEILWQVYVKEIRTIIRSPGAPFSLFYGELGMRGKYGKRYHKIMQAHVKKLELLFERAISMKLIRDDFSAETITLFYAGMIFQAGFIIYNKGMEGEIIKHSELAWKAFLEMIQRK